MYAGAVSKINNEIKASKSNPYIKVIGDFLLKHLESNPADAEKFLSSDKTIGKSLDEMKKEAMKKKVGHMAILTDAEGFAVVLKYFGIASKPVIPPATSVVAAPTPSTVEFDVKLEDFL